MNPERILKDCIARKSIRQTFPSDSDARGHMKKARHDLIVMDDLNRLGHSDWVIITAYYSMYQACLSILSKLGVSSKDHTCTANLIQYLFVIDGKVEKRLLKKFNKMEEIKKGIEEGKLVIKKKIMNKLWVLRRRRETASYGVTSVFADKVISDSTDAAREFVRRFEVLLDEVSKNEKYYEIIRDKVRRLFVQMKR